MDTDKQLAKWSTIKIDFGKYKGTTLYSVYLNEPKYIVWCVDNRVLHTKTMVDGFNLAYDHIYEFKPHIINEMHT